MIDINTNKSAMYAGRMRKGNDNNQRMQETFPSHPYSKASHAATRRASKEKSWGVSDAKLRSPFWDTHIVVRLFP